MNNIICVGCILIGVFSLSFKLNDSKNNQVEKEEISILWSSSKKLTWDDFQGIPDSLSSHQAHTFARISAKNSLRTKEKLEFTVCSLFLVKKSWTKNKNSNELLKHEQLHFDITELTARKLRKNYLENLSTDLEEASILVKEISKQCSKELDSLNNLYDSETNHGIIKDKQKEWETKIAKELKELDKYSSTRVVIKRVKK